jgi:GTPase Era involved in 16S rRNA processing
MDQCEYSRNRIAREKIKTTLGFLERHGNENFFPVELTRGLKKSLAVAYECSQHFRYKIIITGLINSGKTTFINSLLGKFILPTSSLENTKWPVIIRNCDDDMPKLYSSKLGNESVYEFEEDQLLAVGDEKVIEYLNYINTSTQLEDTYRQFEDNLLNELHGNRFIDTTQVYNKDDSVNSNYIRYNINRDKPHCEFIFILRTHITFFDYTINDFNTNFTMSTNYNSEISGINKDLYELWDIPGLNSKANIFTEYVIRNIIENEIRLNNVFPFLHNKRLFMIYLSDCSNFNQQHNNVLWHRLEDIRLYCSKVFFIINKIDQMSEDDNRTFFKSISFDNDITFNNHSIIDILKVNYSSLEDNINYYCLSALYYYIDNCEKNKKLDDFYWKVKEKLFVTNPVLKKEFKTFEKFKKYTQKRIEMDDDLDSEYISPFKNFLYEFNIVLTSNKFLDLVVLNNHEIIKFSIFEGYSRKYSEEEYLNSLKPLGKALLSTNYNFDSNLENLQKHFTVYFKRLKRYFKAYLSIARFKLNKSLHDTKFILRKYIDDICLCSRENYIHMTEIYKNLVDDMQRIKDEFKTALEKENDKLIRDVEFELNKARLKTTIINFYIDNIRVEMKNQFDLLEENLELNGASIFRNFGISISEGIIKGLIGFVGSNVVQNVLHYKSVGLISLSSNFACVVVGIGCLLFYSFKQMETLNNYNKDYLIKRNAELWDLIEKYNEYIYESLRVFVNRSKNNIKPIKCRVNLLFTFLKRTINI